MPRTETERQAIREQKPESWIAVRENDTIMGQLVDVTEAWSDKLNQLKGGWYPLFVIAPKEASGYEDANGKLPEELRVHCFGAVLRNEALRHRPVVGETVRITYRGVGEDKGKGNPPELYTLRVQGRSAADTSARVYDRIEQSAPAPQGASQPGSGAPVPAQPELGSDVNDDDIPF